MGACSFRPPPGRLTVLYDADCGFCTWTVRQLGAIDRSRRLEMVPLQHAARHPERPELAEMARRHDLAGQIHVRRADGAVRRGGGAMLEILDTLPGGRLLRPWARLPGVARLADAAYRLVADRRAVVGRLLARGGAAGATCDLHRRRVT